MVFKRGLREEECRVRVKPSSESVTFNITATYDGTDWGKHLYALLVVDTLTEDAVFPHPDAKCVGVETQKNSCTVFSLDPQTGIMEHLKDVILFQWVESAS
jgi:hypothetical protein